MSAVYIVFYTSFVPPSSSVCKQPVNHVNYIPCRLFRGQTHFTNLYVQTFWRLSFVFGEYATMYMGAIVWTVWKQQGFHHYKRSKRVQLSIDIRMQLLTNWHIFAQVYYLPAVKRCHWLRIHGDTALMASLQAVVRINVSLRKGRHLVNVPGLTSQVRRAVNSIEPIERQARYWRRLSIKPASTVAVY